MRKSAASPIAILLLLSVGLTPCLALDPWVLQRVALIPGVADAAVPCADADHDGQPELYVTVFDSLFRYYLHAWEHVGGNRFDSVRLGGWYDYIHPCYVGDGDRDGRADLLSMTVDSVGRRHINVLEAPDSTSFPVRPVWSAVHQDGGVTGAVFCDLDVDSAQEVVLLYRPHLAVRVYENSGDNHFEYVTSVPDTLRQLAVYRFCATSDVDRDGVPELALGSDQTVVLFEAVADDSFRKLADVRVAASSHMVLGMAAAHDMDGDGRPELVVQAAFRPGQTTVSVIEAPSNDTFAIVWQQVMPCGTWAEDMQVGDIDGDGIEEFAFSDGFGLNIFRCAGPDSYERVWFGTPYWPPMTIYDINSDGLGELIASCDSGLAVLAYVSSGISEQTRRRLEQVVVRPTVVGKGGKVRIAGMGNAPYCHPELGEGSRSRRTADSSASPQNDRNRMADGGVRVEVLDATGRCDKGCDRVAFSGGVAVWDTRGVVPGAYFIRVSSGNLSTTHKVLVLR